MGSIDLERYVRRLSALRETAPTASRSKTVAWILWPLLDELGWEYDAVRSVEPSGALEGELVLSVGSDPPTPALLVAGESTDEQLSDARIESIETTMEQTGIDRTLYANGREFLFLAGTGDDRLRVSAHALPSRETAVALYARDAIRTHCDDLDPEVRAYRRLATVRDELGDSIATLLERRLGSTAAPIDRLTVDFLDAVGAAIVDAPDAIETSGSASEAVLDSPTGSRAPTSSDGSGGGTPGSDTRHADSDTGSGRDDAETSVPASVPPATDPEGEYVVRIFNERGSIGAVGHSTSAGVVAEAASYFFERGLSGIRVPWAPEDGPIVVNDQPVDETGVRWDAFEHLSNGLYVNTAGSVADRASRVEALADRAGLRVMLSGDWSSTDR